MVTKKQLILSCVFNGLNTIMLIYYIYDISIRPSDLEHITRLSYYINSIFTTTCLICDIFLYYIQLNEENFESQQNYKLMNENQEKKGLLERINDFNRNKFGVIFNPLSYFVAIGFWCLYFFGNTVMLVSKNVRSWFNCYYHHLIIQIIILIDIFASERKPIKFSWKQFGIIFGLYSIYCIGIGIEKLFIQRNAYYFMEGKSIVFLICCFLLAGLLLYICYLIHIYLIEYKFNKLDDNYEDKNVCNKIFNSLDKENCMKFIDEKA